MTNNNLQVTLEHPYVDFVELTTLNPLSKQLNCCNKINH